MKNNWKSAIMGVVTGDALGCPVQFESRDVREQRPVMGMIGYGTFNLPAGSWTDDSALTLALMESIARLGRIDEVDIMDNFVRWLENGEFTPYGYAYDIGRGTMNAIRKYERTHDPRTAGSCDAANNGNGSLMRIMPAVLYCIGKDLPDAEAIDIVHRVGSLTHAHIRANIACGLYYFMARAVLAEDGGLKDRLQAGLNQGFAFYEAHLSDLGELEFYHRLRDLDAFADLPDTRIRSTGYVVDTLEAAVWSLITTDSFGEGLLRAVNLGYDTDSVAAVAGGLAGLYYGYEAIPETWLDALKRKAWIEGMIAGIKS